MGATQRVGSARNPTKPFVHFRGILELWGHQGARSEHFLRIRKSIVSSSGLGTGRGPQAEVRAWLVHTRPSIVLPPPQIHPLQVPQVFPPISALP